MGSEKWAVIVEDEDGRRYIHSIWQYHRVADREARRVSSLKGLTAWVESEASLSGRLLYQPPGG